MSRQSKMQQVPGPVDFRAWVQEALVALSVSAASVSRALDLHRNTLRAFLENPERTINLDTAHKVEAHLRGLAADAGVVLGRVDKGARHG